MLIHPAIYADKEASLKIEFMLLEVPFIPLKLDKYERLVYQNKPCSGLDRLISQQDTHPQRMRKFFLTCLFQK